MALTGLAFIICALVFPIFNSYFTFFFNLFVGLFLLICGRGMLLQKNWARKSLLIFVIILTLIIILYTRNLDINLLSMAFLLTLCSGLFYYLSCSRTKKIFVKADGKFNN